MSQSPRDDRASKVELSSLGEPAARRLRLRTPVSVRDDLVRRIESARESNRLSTYSSDNDSGTARSTTQQEATMASFELYQDTQQQYRWRLKAGNGEIIAVSGEGYTTKANAEAGITSVKTNAETAPVTDLTKGQAR
jgi:uncharacterized protein